MAGWWLLKTEPEEWSWEDQHANGGISNWDGVRNALAQKHLRAMANGDLCFFYHSGAKAKEIVGTARVCKTFYPDSSDPTSKHGMVDIEAVSKFALPLPLARLKQEDGLSSFIMFRQPRLSVVPVSSSEWELICKLAGDFEPSLPFDNGDGKTHASSDNNGNVSMNMGDDECGVSLSDMIDESSQPSSSSRRKRINNKLSIDGSRPEPTSIALTVEESRSHGKTRVADSEVLCNTLAEDSLDRFSFHDGKNAKVLEFRQAPELTINTEQVYSRRNRKPRL